MTAAELKKQRNLLDRELRRAGKVKILVTRKQLKGLKTVTKPKPGDGA